MADFQIADMAHTKLGYISSSTIPHWTNHSMPPLLHSTQLLGPCDEDVFERLLANLFFAPFASLVTLITLPSFLLDLGFIRFQSNPYLLFEISFLVPDRQNEVQITLLWFAQLQMFSFQVFHFVLILSFLECNLGLISYLLVLLKFHLHLQLPFLDFLLASSLTLWVLSLF